MTRLPAFKFNDGNVYELFNQRRKAQLKEEKILKSSNKSRNERIHYQMIELLG